MGTIEVEKACNLITEHFFKIYEKRYKPLEEQVEMLEAQVKELKAENKSLKIKNNGLKLSLKECRERNRLLSDTDNTQKKKILMDHEDAERYRKMAQDYKKQVERLKNIIRKMNGANDDYESLHY